MLVYIYVGLCIRFHESSSVLQSLQLLKPAQPPFLLLPHFTILQFNLSIKRYRWKVSLILGKCGIKIHFASRLTQRISLTLERVLRRRRRRRSPSSTVNEFAFSLVSSAAKMKKSKEVFRGGGVVGWGSRQRKARWKKRRKYYSRKNARQK